MLYYDILCIIKQCILEDKYAYSGKNIRKAS